MDFRSRFGSEGTIDVLLYTKSAGTSNSAFHEKRASLSLKLEDDAYNYGMSDIAEEITWLGYEGQTIYALRDQEEDEVLNL